MVVLVHGGPWNRDILQFHPVVQWLANRGYAVVQVNFRGSTGYGKAYLNAGNREWGGKMLADVVDGRRWAVREGYADSRRVCVMGASYGGYAVLMALAASQTEFACGVAVAAPTDLAALARSRWRLWRPLFDRRVGAVESEEALLRQQSPLTIALRVATPLLLAQGGNDANVSRLHSDQFVAKLRGRGKAVEYLVFPDEGHEFTRLANRVRFYAAAEQFLARYLFGRHEPVAPGEEWAPFRR
jgi:dipeptidyl aminopeptidase/acylaminoacyl peptidase